MFRNKFSTRTLVSLAVLVAIQIVLARFLSFSAWNVRIGFGFLPVALAGIFYGPLAAGLVGAVSDIIGAVLFPMGAYFPGFTLTAFAEGMIFGYFLSRNAGEGRPFGKWQILPAVLINQFILSLFVNSFWISVLFGASYRGLLSTRILQCLILAPTQIILLMVLRSICQRADVRRAMLS